MSEPATREPKGAASVWTEERGACDERRGKTEAKGRPEASGTSSVLVIGVDGVRFDYLGPDATPAIWALGQAGFLTAVPVDETTPTWSGPCWATIATGTGVAGHGITGNDLTGHRLARHPDFVTRATRAGLPTLLAVSGWPPLALAEDGGPLFAEASTREFTAVPRAGLS